MLPGCYSDFSYYKTRIYEHLNFFVVIFGHNSANYARLCLFGSMHVDLMRGSQWG